MVRGGPFDFWGGEVWKILKISFLQDPQGKKKNSCSISLVLLKKERKENSGRAHNTLAAILLLPRYNREGLCGSDPRAQCISVYETKKFVIYTPQSFDARHKKIVISM